MLTQPDETANGKNKIRPVEPIRRPAFTIQNYFIFKKISLKQ